MEIWLVSPRGRRGVGDGDDDGDDGGAPIVLQKQKPYELSTNQMHTPCIVLSNLSIQNRSSSPIWAFNKQNQIIK